MPWQGDGTFQRTDGSRTGATVWTQAKAADQDVDAPPHDTHDEDLATGIENCVARDGQNSPTADLPMAGRKHTGVGDATADNEYATKGQLDAATGAQAPVAVPFAAALAWNVANAPAGVVTLTANVTGVTISGDEDGGIYELRINQDGTGGRTITWPTGWLWPAGTAGELSSGANAVDRLSLRRDGTDYYAILVTGWATA